MKMSGWSHYFLGSICPKMREAPEDLGTDRTVSSMYAFACSHVIIHKKLHNICPKIHENCCKKADGDLSFECNHKNPGVLILITNKLLFSTNCYKIAYIGYKLILCKH